MEREVYIAGVNRPVDTGDTYFAEIAKDTISGANMARQMLSRRSLLKRGLISDAPPLKARIEYARWIVDCPNCGGAEFAIEDGLFMCFECKNSDVENKARQVVLPSRRKRLEEILALRPIMHRHWKDGETLKSLIGENKEHNIGE